MSIRYWKRRGVVKSSGISFVKYQRILCLILLCSRFESGSTGNPDAKRLYDDLLSNYNKLVRPVVNVTDALTVKIKLKLSQLIDVVSLFSCTCLFFIFLE